LVSEIKTHKTLLEKKAFLPYTLDDDYKYYTRHELMIECDDPAIQEIADQFKQKTKNPYRFALLAYDYVTENIVYTSPSPSWTAKECIAEKKGACGQQAALFVALCRAGGIPARPVAGTWCEGNDQWHCWAEFLLPEVGWIPADPSVGARGPKEKEYYFGNLDNDHLALMKCFNSKYDCTKGAKDVGFTQPGYWLWFCSGPSKGHNITCEYKLRGDKLDKKTLSNK
jgi:transglutaminase-like putative cysteine protease